MRRWAKQSVFLVAGLFVVGVPLICTGVMIDFVPPFQDMNKATPEEIESHAAEYPSSPVGTAIRSLGFIFVLVAGVTGVALTARWLFRRWRSP